MNAKALSLAAAVLVTAGCSSVAVHSSTAPNVPLAQYRTWAWYPSSHPQRPLTIAEQDIQAAVARKLEEKGLEPATSGQPDFLVAYHAITREKVSVSPAYGYAYAPYPYAYPWGYGYWGPGPDVYTYTEGTIVIDFIDPRTNRVFWRGTATGVVDHPETPNVKKIDKAVSKVLDRYPSMVASANRVPAG